MKRLFVLLLCTLLFAGSVRAQGEVRNLILMIGDGMGLAHTTMLQIENKYQPTAFNRAQGVALITTRSANNRVTDSAAAGTALATGHKTNNGMVGVTPDGKAVESIITRAQKQEMPTGIVVTCYLQHATPAAFYAHVRSRSDERAITKDMLTSGVDVLMGGGRAWLKSDEEGKDYYEAFERRGYRVATTLDEVEDMHSGRLLLVAADEHLPEAAKRGDYLATATKKALELLSTDAAQRGKGFVMMIEGSQIDFASHANESQKILDEMRDFEQAVAAAMDFADRTPGTLVVVTADHETGGLTTPSNEDDFTKSESGLDYKFGTHSHTAVQIPVYLYGTGAGQVVGLMENTELSQRLAELLKL